MPFPNYFLQSLYFLVRVCDNWHFCSVISVIRLWPDRDFLKCLDPLHTHTPKKSICLFKSSGAAREASAAQEAEKKGSCLLWLLSITCFWRIRSLLLTLASASHSSNMGCHSQVFRGAEIWQRVAGSCTWLFFTKVQQPLPFIKHSPGYLKCLIRL